MGDKFWRATYIACGSIKVEVILSPCRSLNRIGKKLKVVGLLMS